MEEYYKEIVIGIVAVSLLVLKAFLPKREKSKSEEKLLVIEKKLEIVKSSLQEIQKEISDLKWFIPVSISKEMKELEIKIDHYYENIYKKQEMIEKRQLQICMLLKINPVDGD